MVVYKIDRLPRSLTDFSKMIELFERHGVSFVSVTRQFNTTNSMGRLMLNILLSFAQFEREVTGERIRGKVPFLLKGLVFGSDGRAMSPYHTKNRYGRRYRYYQPQRDAKEHAGASGLPRLPAADLESAVMEQIRAILRSPQMVEEAARRAVRLDPTLDEAQVTVAMTRMDEIWEQLFPDEQARIVKLLVEKVIVSPNDIEVRLRPNGIEMLALEFWHSTEEVPA